MKALSHFKCSLVVWMLMVGFTALAQPDLTVIANGAPFQFVGDGQPHSIQLQVDNIGDLDTVAGISLTVAYDMFVDPTFTFLDTFSGSDWDCPNFSTSLTCTFIGNLAQSSASFLNLNVSVQPGDFNFVPAFIVSVTDINGDESGLNNNSSFVDVEYIAGIGTDFHLSVSPGGNPILLPAGGGVEQLTYTVTNDISGQPEGDQTSVVFSLNPQIEPASVIASDPTWSCVSVTAQITCLYNSIYPNGYSSDLVLSLTSPVTPTTIVNALDVSLTNASGDPNLGDNTIDSDIDFITGSFVDLSLTKTITSGFSATVSPGDPLSFDITVTHLTGPDATNVIVMDDLLANSLQFDAANSSSECIDVGSFVECSLLNLPVGDSVTFTIASTVSVNSQSGLKTNVASVSADEPDPVNTNNSNSVPFTVALGPSADLDLSIVANNSVYNIGDVITLDLTLHNSFASNAAPLNTTVITTLPNDVIFSSAQVNVSGWQCSHDLSLTGGLVTCDSLGIPVAIGTNTLIEITAVANSAATFALVNTVVNSDFDPMPGNNNDSTSFAINFADADLSIAFTSISAVYNQGDTISYDIQVSNPMASTANPSDVNVSITLPAEVVLDNINTASAPGWSCATVGGQIDCDRAAPFVSNSVHVFTVDVLANAPTTNASIQAEVSSVADTITSNNMAFQSDVINGLITDFSIVKTVSASNFNVGDNIVYSLTVNNELSSTGAPNDVVISDQLPAEVTYNSYVANSNLGTTINCTHDAVNSVGLFTCNTVGMPFAVGEVVTIDIDVSAVTPSGAVNNTATVTTSTDSDGITMNNVSAAPAVVISGASTTTISATKSTTVAGVNVTGVNYGQAFEYVLQVDNTGANNALNVQVVDNLPAEVTLASLSAPGWNCLPIGLGTKSSGGKSIEGFGETVDCTLSTPLMTGSNSQITLNVVATANTAISSITNQMEASGDNTGASVTSSNTVNLLSSVADLIISQSPSPVDLSAAVNFDLVFANTGNVPLNGVQIVSDLPQDFIYNGFTADSGVSCTENSGTVSCLTVNPLAANNSLNLSLNLTTPATLTVNQSYDLQSTASANELTNPIIRTLTTSFLTSDYNIRLSSAVLQANPGESFRHSMSISNTGDFNLNNIQAIFSFPSHVQLIDVLTVEMSCTLINNAVNCVNLQPLAPTARLSASFILQANDSSNEVSSQVFVNADGINKTATTSTQINPLVIVNNDLALVKTASVNQVGQQGAFSYIFNVMNVGLNDQTNILLTDELPEGVTYQTSSGNDWTCVGNTSINCEFNGILSAGTQSQLTMDVIAPTSIGLVSNTAIITTPDDNPGNNQSTVHVEVVTGSVGGSAIADLAVQMTASSIDILNSEQLTWTIDLMNLGPDTAQNIRLENQLPMGFVADQVLVNGNATCVLLTGSLVCEVDALTINQTIQINLIGGFNTGYEGQVMNVVEVTSNAIDPNLSNNQSQVQVNVTAVENTSVDLALASMTQTQEIRQGDVFELKFKSKNSGPDAAINPTIVANISGLISQVQIVNSGLWACQTSQSSLSCQYAGNYPVGSEQLIVLHVITEQVEQTSQPLVFNAIIESASTETNPANNLISITNEVAGTPTEDEIFDIFAAAVGPGASETVMRTIRNVSSYCARKYFMAIEGLCDEMIASARPENSAAIINVMEEITPNEVSGQSVSANEIMASQFSNIGSRLSELRGGGGSGFSVAGLNGRYGNESIPIGMLAYLNQSEDEQQAVSNINDFISPWGFFVNGSISMGERDATGRELGFDFDTYGLTAGVDYRFSPTKVAGVALGYANFDSKIEDEAEMKSTSLTLTGYGSFYIKDNFYMDARISYGSPDFEQKRRINFALDNTTIDRIATGETNANQYSVAMSVGYHFNKNSWNITPNASMQYVRTSIDAFQETGAGGFNFMFAEQEIKSMVWSVGTSVSKAISLKNGVISPQFDFNFSRETEDDGGLIVARFITAPADEIFYIETDEPDRTYGSAGVGLVFIGANGKQAYINYRSIFGLDGFTRGTINLGARFEF